MTPSENAPPEVVVLGGINTDYVVHADTFLGPGESIQGSAFLETPGGKGGNGATAAVRLGARAALVGRVGADARGEALLAQLVREGVDVRAVRRDTDAATGAALIVVAEGGGKQSAAALGANRRVSVADVTAAAPCISSALVLLVQLEVPVEAVEAAVRLARTSGVRVVLDPAPPAPLSDALLRELYVLRSNASEATALTGVEVRDEDSARRAAADLLRRGVNAAIVAVPSGNLLVSRVESLWLPNVPVDSVDSTGAGDAFAAALAVSLVDGRPLPEAFAFAHAAAALATTRLGAQPALPRRDEVLELQRSGLVTPEPLHTEPSHALH